MRRAKPARVLRVRARASPSLSGGGRRAPRRRALVPAAAISTPARRRVRRRSPYPWISCGAPTADLPVGGVGMDRAAIHEARSTALLSGRLRVGATTRPGPTRILRDHRAICSIMHRGQVPGH